MTTTPPPLDFGLDLSTQSQVAPQSNAAGLTTIQSDGLHIESGLPFYTGLNDFGLEYDTTLTDTISNLEPFPAQTLNEAVIKGIVLSAGEKLLINYDYIAGDVRYDDFAFSILSNEAGGSFGDAEITPAASGGGPLDPQGDLTGLILGSEQNYIDTGTTGRVATYTVGTSGTYDLMLAAADVGDTLEPSAIDVHSVSIEVPASDYTITPSGVQTTDGTVFRPDGSVLLPDGSVAPGLLSGAATDQVETLQADVSAGLIGEDGSSLIGEDGSSLSSPNGNALIGEDGSSLISQDGNGLISQDGNGLIGEDGSSLIGEDGSSLIGEDGSSLIASNASSLINENGGGIVGGNELHVLDLDESGDLPRQDSDVPPAVPTGPAVPGTEFPISGGLTNDFTKAQEKLIALPDGKFVVAWTDFYTGSGVGSDTIAVQLFNPDGSTAAPEFDISATSDLTDLTNSIGLVALPGDGYALSYVDLDQSATPPYGSTTNLDVQVFDATGAAVGGVSQLGPPVNEVATLDAMALSDGSFGILESGFEGADQTVQRVSASGAAEGGPIAIDPADTSAQAGAITALPNGAFALTFLAVIPGTQSTYGLYYQVVDADGTQNAPILLETGRGSYSTMAVLTDGNIVVAWSESAVHAQVITPAGVLVGSEIVAEFNSNSSGTPSVPTVTALSDGRFMIAYALPNPSNPDSSTTVDARIYNADGTASGDYFAGSSADPQTIALYPVAAQLNDGTVEIVSSRQGSFADSSSIVAEPVSLSGEAATGSAAAMQQGRVVDGYISGATVFADANGDGALSAGEASAITDALGRYSFTTPASGPVIVTGGTDISTGLAVTQTLSAPAGSLTVSPLTTLVQKIDAANGGNLVLAERQVNADFGLAAATDLTALDPVRSAAAGSTNGAAALVAGALVADTVALAAAAGASGDLYGMLAAQVEANPTSFDPTSVAAMQALGLTGTAAADASALAQASAALLHAAQTADATNAPALLLTGTAVEKVAQGATSAALVSAVGDDDFDSVLSSYTGSGLANAVTAAEAACFASGTRIATPHGEIRVESLRVGDVVATQAGRAQAICWIGHRSVACGRHPRPWDVWPVCVRQDAFGPAQPARDLFLSPDHAVMLDGVLIPIRYLINGATIVQQAVEHVTYWHVELPCHDILLADGLAAESYLDTGNRSAFADYEAPHVLYGGALTAATHSATRTRAAA